MDKSDNAMRRFAFWGPVTSDRAHMWHACADRYSHLKKIKKLTQPTPGGFRRLNCLARLALARERTPSEVKGEGKETKGKTKTKVARQRNVSRIENIGGH